MNNLVLPQDIYADTSALRSMNFYKGVASLLALSKAGKIRLHISETTLWERGRQQFENDVSRGDRIVPFPDGINRYLAWFKILFQKYGVRIIPSDDRILELTTQHLQNENSYFSHDIENDQRDAHVLATAEVSLEKDVLILCHDKNLAKAFGEVAGFTNVCRDSNSFLSEVVGDEADIPRLDVPSLDDLSDYQIYKTFTESFHEFINKADHRFHQYLITLPKITDKLSAKLENMQALDAEIRKRVLGYAQWFSPVTKKDLHILLTPKHYDEEQIESNAQRLKQEDLLTETENHWLPNTQNPEAKEICDQAMALVMPEILEILELS